MNEIQSKLFKMLSWFHEFSIRNGMKYYIAYGTLLGAVRHQGFIPWDDDVDICMPRDDYEKCKQIFSNTENLIDTYMLETPYSNESMHIFNKIYDTKTIVVERLRKKIRRGISLDIFPLDGAGKTLDDALQYYKKIDKYHMFLMTRVCAIRRERDFLKNVAIIISRIIPSCMINEKKLSIKIDKMCQKRKYDEFSYVCEFMGPYRSKAILEKRIFGTPVLYKFEGIDLYGPECAEEYLSHIYGDWRILPPPDKQKTQHDFIEVDLQHSYMNG